LVESDWIELVRADIQKAVSGTFLQGAPVVEVSAYTGQGIEALRTRLFELVARAGAKTSARPFRLPVDRVFSMEGHGTVLTGTLTEGGLSVGEEAELYPAGLRVRVRNLQVHSSNVETAEAGQRVAVNVAGIKRDEVVRGDVLALPGSMQNSRMLDVRLCVLKDSKRAVTDGSRLHFYHGAREALCKVALLEGEPLEPGQEGFVQLRFTEEVAAKKGDRFVVRFYSPLETVGGGVILHTNPPRHRRRDARVLEGLRIREQGSAASNLLRVIEEGSPRLMQMEQVQKQLAMDGDAFKYELAQLIGAGSVVLLSRKVAVAGTYVETMERRLCGMLEAYHAQNHLQAGMRRDELRGRLLPGVEIALADKLLVLFVERGAVTLTGQRVALCGFTVRFDEKDQGMADGISERFLRAGYAPPMLEELLNDYPKERVAAKKVFDALLERGVLVMAGPQVFFHREATERARGLAAAHIQKNGEITLAQFRDILDTSRKFALPLLEYFDAQGFTIKKGEARTLRA
jgi:selenocysteine-specific elongation factor